MKQLCVDCISRGVVIVLLGLAVACAQDPETGPPTATSIAPLAEIPMESATGIPLIEVTAGASATPLVLLLDTGFDVSVLDTAAAVRLGLEPQAVHHEAQPGGAIEVGSLPPISLRIGAHEVADVSLTAIDIAGLAMMIGRPFDGILGHDLLERFIVDLDFPNQTLRLYDPASWQPPAAASLLDVEIRERQPFAHGALITSDRREVAALFKLDTGSFDIAGLNLNFVRDHNIVPAGAPEVALGGVAVGGETEGRLFRAGAIELGPLHLDNPLIGYTTDSAGFEERPDAGTVGAGLLAGGRLILDYPHHRVAFVGPFSHQAEDATGMLLVSPAPEFTELLVALVIAGSPAAEAGLRPGDRLLSLAGREGLTLVEARALQRHVGPLEVTYLRDGDRVQTTIERRPVLPYA